MATERLSMRKSREILRQKWVLGRSHREVVSSLGISAGIVTKIISRATAAGIDQWSQVEELSDSGKRSNFALPCKFRRLKNVIDHETGGNPRRRNAATWDGSAVRWVHYFVPSPLMGPSRRKESATTKKH